MSVIDRSGHRARWAGTTGCLVVLACSACGISDRSPVVEAGDPWPVSATVVSAAPSPRWSPWTATWTIHVRVIVAAPQGPGDAAAGCRNGAGAAAGYGGVAEGAGAAVLDGAGAVVGAGVVGAGVLGAGAPAGSGGGAADPGCVYPLAATVTAGSVDLTVQIAELSPCALSGPPPDTYVCVIPPPHT